ncbi:PepSY domain-containing protein [Streptomyces sp. NPDC057654]|uniref:PepSY domain-containing protein n=1 Tax=Streptomyces sp. NPDC057654 TaxID=3346196 RepID=UPI0036B2BA0A
MSAEPGSVNLRRGVVRTRWGRAAGVLCGVVVSAALVSGCGDDGGGGGSSATSGATASAGSSGSAASSAPASGAATETAGLTEDQAERKALLPTAKVDYERAARIAAGAVPNGKVSEIELKRITGGGSQWRSKVAERDGTAHEVNVDAGSGKVTRSRTEPGQDSEDKRELADRLGKAKVSAQQAVRTSAERKPGTTTAVEIDDRDDGTTIWSVDQVNTDTWNKTTFDVDAAGGKVLREHVDRD